MSLSENRFHPLLRDSHCSSTHGDPQLAAKRQGTDKLLGAGWLDCTEILDFESRQQRRTTELENDLRGHRLSFQLMSRMKLNMAISSSTFPTAGGKPNSRPESTDAVNNLSSNLCCVIAASQRVSEFWAMTQTLWFLTVVAWILRHAKCWIINRNLLLCFQKIF